MKPHISSSLMIASLLAFLLLAGRAQAQSSPSDTANLTATVQALGRINGQALACQHKEVASRIKGLMITRVPKTRELGEQFEQGTTAAFLAHGQSGVCPPAVALTVELEHVVRPLAPPPSHVNANSTEQPSQGFNPRYLLQATNGRSIMDGDFRDRFQLLSFGYTFCPDICPTTLLEMAAILKELGDKAEQLQPVFISVDPARDTPVHLRQYLDFFDQRIIGATGSAELIKRAADNFKVKYEKVVEPGADPNNYAMDHSAGMFLLAPGGQFITKFAYGTPVADIVAKLQSEFKLQASLRQAIEAQRQAPAER